MLDLHVGVEFSSFLFDIECKFIDLTMLFERIIFQLLRFMKFKYNYKHLEAHQTIWLEKRVESRCSHYSSHFLKQLKQKNTNIRW